MRHAITRKITCIIISIVAGTVFLCWLLNTTLLESYYVSSKKDNLKDVLKMTDQAIADGTMYKEASKIELEKNCAKGNITMMIMNPESSVLFLVGGTEDAYVQQFWEILFRSQDVNTEVLENLGQDGRFTMGKYRDSRLNTEYLILWGFMEDGNLLLMRTALESIRESVDTSSRFLMYLGAAAVIVSAVISYFVTKRFTNPILELADLSQRMTNLDFDAKFHSRGKDEIDALGEHMNKLSETLERTISELKSANNELLIDIEKKNRIDDMRKEFLSNVSHELKTPLALIQGYAEGLKECINEDPESREFYCDVIMDEADKMNIMVKQLLTLNQLEFGKDAVTMERFDVTEVIRGVIQATAILREQNDISVEFLGKDGEALEENETPLYVWADEFKTEEVLTNFMSNAIHYASGEKKIVIRQEQREDVVRISVYNTGPQIPEEDVDKIWQKFYKVDKARTREYGGSGIGLSIVKAIMDSFHRQCGVVNHPKGVEFWFELDTQGTFLTEKTVNDRT